MPALHWRPHDFSSESAGQSSARDPAKRHGSCSQLYSLENPPTLNHQERQRSMTTFPHPLFLHAQAPSGISQLKTALLEPLFVTAVGLFLLTALPIGACFSAAVAAYDKMTALSSTAFRLPLLLSNAATSPWVLKRKGVALRRGSSRASSARHVVRA